jgi:hypothetical protein
MTGVKAVFGGDLEESTVSFRELKKSTLEKRAVSETALFSEKTALEKRADYKSPLFPRLKGHFDWRAHGLCLLSIINS